MGFPRAKNPQRYKESTAVMWSGVGLGPRQNGHWGRSDEDCFHRFTMALERNSMTPGAMQVT
jgi:hypothetical protein